MGGALLVVGAVVAIVGLQRPGPRLEVVTPERFVNLDRPGINAHNSPAVAVSPSDPNVMAVADRTDTPRQACTVSRSTDGGATWLRLAGFDTCFWPDVAFTGDGTLLVLATTLAGPNNQPASVSLHRFAGAEPAGPPIPVTGGEAFHARLATDGARVVVTWVQAGPEAASKALGLPAPPNPVVAVRSVDGGLTFSSPVRVSEPDRLVVQPEVVLGPGPRVVVSALDLGQDRLDYEGGHEGQGGPPEEGRWGVVTWRSDDGGASFGPVSVVSADLVIPQRIYSDLAPAPGLALDRPRDRLYATWDAGRGDQREVFVARSDDGGATWSPARPVAARPRSQFLPALGVAPDGRVDVLFYDRSRDPSDVMTEVAMASSWDVGRSFTVATVSNRSFDSRIGFGSSQGVPTLGSQLAIVSEAERSQAFWSDTRDATLDDNAQDLAVAAVGVDGPGQRRWLLVVLGGVVLLGGLLVLVLASPRPARRG